MRPRRAVAAGMAAFVFGLPSIVVAAIQPQVLLPGYVVTPVSEDVASERIAQLAFKPGDAGHLFAVRATGSVVRYDYDPVDGTLSSAVTVASGLGESLGLAFHGEDLYVSLDLGGSLVERPGDGRITRLSSPDAAGIYQLRHDFVHSLDKGDHDLNQIQIVGDTLFVGVGAVGHLGDPAQENAYSMTLARIADLTAVDFSGPVDMDFKGPVNALADETEWADPSVSDGKLRYYASGFRNPYGVAIDLDGDVWVSTNGNSGFGVDYLSPDYLYKKVPPGGQGVFPPASFGFGAPHVTGTPIAPLSDLGQSPSPTGFDFVPSGPDQGKVVLAQAGSFNQASYPVGKNVLLVDPDGGAFQVLVDGFELPTDVVRDPFGRLLISDYLDNSVWLLTPPQGPGPAGRVPDGAALTGQPLKLDYENDTLTLSWGPSCSPGDDDYEVYEGQIGSYYSHRSLLCTTSGEQSVAIEAPAGGGHYYLVVPANGSFEGSSGRRSGEIERPVGAQACLPRSIAEVCP